MKIIAYVALLIGCITLVSLTLDVTGIADLAARDMNALDYALTGIIGTLLVYGGYNLLPSEEE